MIEPETVLAAWSWASSRPAAGALRAIHFKGSSDSIWAAVTPDGTFGVLIGMRTDESISDLIREVGNSRVALLVEHYPFHDENRDVRAVLITCAQVELREAFAAFCSLFVERCQWNEPKAKVFLHCIAEFKRLIAHEETINSPAILTGLIGELLTLSDLTSVTDAALDCWAYPELARHDFRNGSVAVEVKSSLRSRQSKPTIIVNSFDQLDAPSPGHLFLTWILLERDPRGLVSIDKVSSSVASALGPNRASAFKARLAQAPLDEESRSRSFTVLERREFVVPEGFPSLRQSRLKAEALDSGVSGVTYTLDLSAAEAFRCASGSAVAALASGRVSR